MARVARYTLLYYASSTAVAVTLGIILVNVINPGRGGALSSDAVTSCRGADLKVGDIVAKQLSTCVSGPDSFMFRFLAAGREERLHCACVHAVVQSGCLFWTCTAQDMELEAYPCSH